MLCKLLCRYLHGRRPDRGRLRTSCARLTDKTASGHRSRRWEKKPAVGRGRLWEHRPGLRKAAGGFVGGASEARPSLRSPAGRRNPGGFEAILRTPPYVKCQNFLDILAGLWIKITNFVL